MAKALLLSVCIAMVALPIMAAKDPHPGRGLKRAVWAVLAFNLFYIVVVRVIVPRLG